MSRASDFIKLTGRSIYEMANLQPRDTNVPVKIWVDEVGINRKEKHNIPRIKIVWGGKLIPVSIDKEPRILIDSIDIDSKIFNVVSEWILLNLDSLLKHWNQEYTTNELFLNLKRV